MFCIKKFYNADDRVEFHDIEANQYKFITAKDALFCAMRVWDQRAEEGFMQDIENRYKVLIEQIILKPFKSLSRAENDVISDMFLLWQYRALLRNKPIPNQRLNGVQPPQGPECDRDFRERLEKLGVISMNQDGEVAGRHFAGTQIQMRIDQHRKAIGDRKWGVLYSKNLEFLVPDIPRHYILPVTPNICFVLSEKSRNVSDKGTRTVNYASLNASTDYCFAKDINKCFF